MNGTPTSGLLMDTIPGFFLKKHSIIFSIAIEQKSANLLKCWQVGRFLHLIAYKTFNQDGTVCHIKYDNLFTELFKEQRNWNLF